MDPSATKIAAWNNDDTPATVRTLCEWAGIHGNLRAALLTDIDAAEDEVYRGLAAISDEDLADTMEELMVDGPTGHAAMSKIQKAKVKLLFHAARVAAGVEDRGREETT